MNRYVITDYGVIPNTDALQTESIQKVLDLCKNGGGTVVIPRGCFCIASLRMWSDTTLYLEAGAELLGSEECTDYEVFPVPEGVELRTDMELITQYYLDKPWQEYRRAMISAYGERNIAIIGEGDIRNRKVITHVIRIASNNTFLRDFGNGFGCMCYVVDMWCTICFVSENNSGFTYLNSAFHYTYYLYWSSWRKLLYLSKRPNDWC